MIDTLPYERALELISIERWLLNLEPRAAVGEPGDQDSCVVSRRMRAFDAECAAYVTPHYASFASGTPGEVELMLPDEEGHRHLVILPLDFDVNLLAEAFDQYDFSRSGVEGPEQEEWEREVSAAQALLLVAQLKR